MPDSYLANDLLKGADVATDADAAGEGAVVLRRTIEQSPLWLVLILEQEGQPKLKLTVWTQIPFESEKVVKRYAKWCHGSGRTRVFV